MVRFSELNLLIVGRKNKSGNVSEMIRIIIKKIYTFRGKA